jgi:hypothetical protein
MRATCNIYLTVLDLIASTNYEAPLSILVLSITPFSLNYWTFSLKDHYFGISRVCHMCFCVA